MNTIITIGRQFGSAGREIGEKVAAHYGIKCYDKELLSRAAKESGFCQEMIENHDERPTNSFLYNLVMDTYSFGYNSSSFIDMPISHKVFLAQFDTIKSLADEGPCVIVGRCADYALSEYKNCLNLFIYGEEDVKVKRIMEKYDLNESKALDMIIKKDKQRQSYYNYYSSKKWAKVAVFTKYGEDLKSLFVNQDGSLNETANYNGSIIDLKNYIYVWIPNFSIKDDITYFRYGTSKKIIKMDFTRILYKI